jgi:membrane protein YqaA with SNARE-associated domain
MGKLSAWPELIPLVLSAAWCHGPASPFLPAAFEPVLMAYGRSHSPLLIALVAVLTSVGVESMNYLGYGYLLRSRRLSRVRETSARLTALFARRPFLVCLLVAATPLPDWSVRVLGAFARYPARRYLLAFALGRVPKFWLLATLGHALQLSGTVLLTIAAGSLLLTYAAMWLRRLKGSNAAAGSHRSTLIMGHAETHP